MTRKASRPARGAREGSHHEIQDVIHGLLSDGDAIDHPTYESWASDFGYDTDSRKGEALYRTCLEIGLKLRSSLGDENLRKLRDEFQGY